MSDEFLDRWRTPGDRRSRVWEERFGETRYVAARGRGIRDGAESRRGESRRRRQGGGHRHARPGVQVGRPRARGRRGALADDLSATVGQAGTAQPGLLLSVDARDGRPGQVVAVRLPRRRCRRPRLPDHCGDRRVVAGRPGRRAGRRRRRLALRHLPRLARDGHARATAPARALAGIVRGGLAQRAVEVRVRRFAGPDERGRAPPAVARLDEGRRRRRHGADRTRRHPGHHRHLHRRPARPTRRAPRSSSPWSTSTAAGGSPSSSPTSTPTTVRHRRPGGHDLPQALHRGRHPRLLLEGQAGAGRRRGRLRTTRTGRRRWHRTGSRTGWRSSAWGAPGSPSTGTRASTT